MRMMLRAYEPTALRRIAMTMSTALRTKRMILISRRTMHALQRGDNGKIDSDRPFEKPRRAHSKAWDSVVYEIGR
jgi:hypothetical protein